MSNSATLNDLVNALFKSDDEFNRKNFIEFFNIPSVDLREKVDFTLMHIVREEAGHEGKPYRWRFLDHFEREELERVFGHDLYDKLILVKQLFEDRRLRDIKYHYQYLGYFVALLPAMLKKAQSKEDVLRWDKAVKDIIVEYAELEHPDYYINYPLRQLVFNSKSLEMLEKARELIIRAKKEMPSHIYVFTNVLSIVLGKVSEPQRLEEWYQPIIYIMKRYGEDISRRAYSEPLIEFVKAHNNPNSLNNFSPSWR